MPHVTISGVRNEENGAEKSFSYSFFFSRLNGKVDKNLSYFFVPFPFFCVGEGIDFGSSFKEKASFWKNKSLNRKALTTFFVYLQPQDENPITDMGTRNLILA